MRSIVEGFRLQFHLNRNEEGKLYLFTTEQMLCAVLLHFHWYSSLQSKIFSIQCSDKMISFIFVFVYESIKSK